MEHNDQLHVEAEEALANINKKTGRNMPQAVATGAVLVIIILASLLIRIDVFVLLIVVFMVLALWELRVDFATVGLHIPVVALWLCSAAILLGTYYSPYHFGTMALLTMATLMPGAILGHRPVQLRQLAFARRRIQAVELRRRRARAVVVQP